MTMLAIDVVGAQPAAQTAAPAVAFRLRIEEVAGRTVHAIALRCQVRIEPQGRRHTSDEQERLYELFGHPSQWSRTLRGVTWAQCAVLVPSFDARIEIDLPVACTYDLQVASAKYLHAIRNGDVPLTFLFSGTMFSIGETGMCAEPVPWSLEATYRLPMEVWQSTMDQFFPGGGWLRLERDTIDRLQAFRGRHAVVSWDAAIDILLRAATVAQPAVK